MGCNVTIIGFGEAAAAFVAGWASPPAELCAYDLKTDQPGSAAAKLAEYAQAGVTPAATSAAALTQADLVLCLVTADQALRAAQTAAAHLRAGTLWCDKNSVAPATKCAAARVIEAAGGRYLDVAVMAPVHPARAATPLLISGTDAAATAALLRGIGFTSVRALPGPVGRASAIKMIRSVIVKGIEALTAECTLAAVTADVLDEVLASLDASPAPGLWRDRAAYHLDRMMIHGLRRAAEMDEVVKTLDALGTGSVMSRGTADRQRAIGALAAESRGGLEDRLRAVMAAGQERAA
jgi:3-hydroxyisobutyrate dehydrogenase-like beta-hydroxyacid dehydrogenase